MTIPGRNREYSRQLLELIPRVKTEVKSEPGIRQENGLEGGDQDLGGGYTDDVPAREMAEWGLPTSFAMSKNSAGRFSMN